ncbi:MAG: hypothetical protein Fur009_5630 [Candidatus Microgenomates bacterium]
MANKLTYKNNQFQVGDTLSVHYKLKEGDKERIQIFKGILIKVKGDNENNKTFTVRKVSKSGVGVERIFPVNSPYIADIVLIKKSSYKKAKAYFIRNLSERELKRKLYKEKNINNK